MALLELDGVQTYIGEYHILQGVTLAVPPGAITVLLGRNGAGKTTTLRTVMGLTPARAGRVVFRGEEITRLAPHQVARRGIGYVPEDRGIFRDLTVAENLRVAVRGGDLPWPLRGRAPEGYARGGPADPPRGSGLEARLDWVLRLFPDLARAWRRTAGTLSGGQQQMLAIGRVLLSENALLLIDEPSKGLAPVVVEQLGEALRQIAAQTTVLLVEQNFGLAAAVGDHAVVLDDGRTVYQGSMAEILGDAALRRRYLGVA
ncbi:branched-chain amino acid transport system ATP-binding protein [Symbiobacterium terraclitae]|uniref:Branched-chain amino acid transport system ATP-binding protein n=1 Tax=Symbiobacterium terraclitae TaxID=557451 RepID=A0ABS4JUU0_9FIRM|nr:ABC transporter ATP-binding protein [Symbiobacterium terraclitae]MBP2019280.1 branched-chain amino acid transport system ATP-binding protein [Symbiobacterium terraclitae]